MHLHPSSPRKRSLRSFLLGVAVLASHGGVVQAFSATTSTTTTVRAGGATTRTTDQVSSPFDNENPYRNNNQNNYFLDENDLDLDWDEEYSTADNNFVQALQDLQQSTGTEVPHTGTDPAQVEQLLQDLFHGDEETTDMERIAMRSVTQQLPQAAQLALQPKKETNQQFKRKNMQYATTRVTPEQEVVLARAIQTGARLQSLKDEAEAARDGKPLTKTEWAALANLTPKELRRHISLYRQAKHILVQANLGLVHAVVNQQWQQQQFLKRSSGVSKEELIQEGSLGLLRAAELFDPNRGLRFSTYAVVWIKGVLQNTHVRELVRLPQREKTKWHKICQATRELEATTGQTATWEDIAKVTDLSVSEVLRTHRLMQYTKTVSSLDATRTTHNRSGTEAVQQHDHSPWLRDDEDEALVTRTQLRADLIAALARNLNAREARLVRLRYGLADGVARSLAECADAMGLSRTRVQQLNQRCLAKLRTAAEAESLQEYLLTIA